jgi:hypothetical protein
MVKGQDLGEDSAMKVLLIEFEETGLLGIFGVQADDWMKVAGQALCVGFCTPVR